MKQEENKVNGRYKVRENERYNQSHGKCVRRETEIVQQETYKHEENVSCWISIFYVRHTRFTAATLTTQTNWISRKHKSKGLG
jgi:hypothetical protein